MKTSMSIRPLCLILVLGFLPLPGHAQSAEELLQEIAERKERINQFRALLNDPDQTTRLAALDVMLKSDDSAMREIAYGAGFSSADDAMRALALKGRFRDLTVLPITLSPTEQPTENEKKILQNWADTYRFQVKDFTEASGHFTFKGGDSSGEGQISGTGLEFESHYCRGQFTLGDGASLVGELRCQAGYQGHYVATARLQ